MFENNRSSCVFLVFFDGEIWQDGILRLRTYLPVFSSYVDEGDVSAAFQLYNKMKNTKGVILLSEHYIQLMACIAENGFFR
jgi:pentatricopeptide repeat protein